MADVGKVFLVGAGPGDPGLLTLKGLACLQQADLVLYDGLVNPLLLRHTSALAERTCRSSSRAGRILDQEEINRRLVEAARAGKCVVRLKGGDPYIFGRGSEEAAALVDAGIPFEVVPGVTAATAAGEYAGISLTHREWASTVTFVTGHEDPAKAQPAIDYVHLAGLGGTLVFYMGLNHLEQIAERLIAAGKLPQTPACVISRASTPLQRTVVAPLAELGASVRSAGLRPPSLIVIGECVQMRERLHWFESRPLFGKRIGITRPEGQSDPQIARTLELGALPVLLPTIQILPPEDWNEVDRQLQRIRDYDWLIFTSANGVQSLLGRLWETGGDARRLSSLKIATIGPSTAEALEEFRLRADLIPDAFRAEALADALAAHVRGKRILWARASRGRDVLPAQLEQAGAEVDQLVVYRNEDVPQFPPESQTQIVQGGLDWIGLSSPSIARSLIRLWPQELRASLGISPRLCAISPVTAEAAAEAGLPVAAVAETYTWEGVFAAILKAEGL